MSVRSLDSGEAYAFVSTETFTFHLAYFGCHFPPPFLRASGQSELVGMVCVGKLCELRGSDDR